MIDYEKLLLAQEYMRKARELMGQIYRDEACEHRYQNRVCQLCGDVYGCERKDNVDRCQHESDTPDHQDYLKCNKCGEMYR